MNACGECSRVTRTKSVRHLCCYRPRGCDDKASTYEASQECLPALRRFVSENDTSDAVVPQNTPILGKGRRHPCLEKHPILRPAVDPLDLILNNLALLRTQGVGGIKRIHDGL